MRVYERFVVDVVCMLEGKSKEERQVELLKFFST
jgi:hypothetical protein